MPPSAIGSDRLQVPRIARTTHVWGSKDAHAWSRAESPSVAARLKKSSKARLGLDCRGERSIAVRVAGGRSAMVSAGHSMTSSTWSRTDSGTSIPSAAAVRRFTTKEKFVNCSIGISAGLSPGETLVKQDSSWTTSSRNLNASWMDLFPRCQWVRSHEVRHDTGTNRGRSIIVCRPSPDLRESGSAVLYAAVSA